MSQKIAVALIHGAGSQGPDFAIKMVNTLTRHLQEKLPEVPIADNIVFKPVYWASILARKQHRLWKNVTSDDKALNFQEFREFIINFGADAVAYQPGANRREVYNRVHQAMASALSDLAAAAGPQAPLCIISHSIGTVVTHNYFYDLGEAMIADEQISRSISPLEAGTTLSHLYMMGSPLALWSLRYDNYRAIQFPGAAVARLYPHIVPKWLSFYDTDDILAYPIRSLSPGHYELFNKGLLRDVQVNAGGWLSSWNPLSHMQYWEDAHVIETVADELAGLWRQLNPPDRATKLGEDALEF